MAGINASNPVKLVMNGFKNLTSDQQKEFIEVINEYLKANHNERKILEESFVRAIASTGPLGGNVCKCCGK